MEVDAEQRRISHLLRRAGFGGTPNELKAYRQLGFDAAVAQLVDYERVPNDALEAQVAELEEQLDLTKLPSVQQIWLLRMLLTAHPLEEKMTLFWHNHFATANYKVGNAEAMYAQNQFLRANALGDFRAMLRGISRDPAMLRWLDGNQNRKGSPNENYARELMELFTLGIGNYTEDDVREVARAFTGWFVDRDQGFVFNANQHDFEDKTILGQTGPWDGDDALDIILDQSAAAQHLAEKLFTFFVHDHPTPSTLSRLANLFRESQYSVRELVRAILHSPEFSSAEAMRARVKSPVEFLVGAMKQLEIDTYLPNAPGLLRQMGMDLFNPPNVGGWEWGLGWISSATLLNRLNVASGLTTQRGANAGFGMDPALTLRTIGAKTPEETVDGLLDLLMDGDAQPAARARLLAYMTDGYNGGPQDFLADDERVDRTVRGVTHLIMAMPAYHLA